ncbi:MAG: DNA-directed DNA polymerase [Candidatus Hydrothermarchaeota archaeon]|nr:DNA-directed DNA polymerase [Candidatus Hydrothermarchaeota archaeon]
MKGFLLDADYETRNNKAVVKLFFKGAEGSFTAIDDGFPPYLYAIPEDGLEEVSKRLRRVEKVMRVEVEEKNYLGSRIKALKVFVQHPQDVPKIRETIRNTEGVAAIHEHDILFVRRYLIDRDLRPLTWVAVEGKVENGELHIEKISPATGGFPDLKVLSFDIEVHNPKVAPREKVDPIIMISMASSTGLKKVLTWKQPKDNLDFVEVLEDEKAVLQGFCDIVIREDHDVLVGYNTDNFDFPYILNRAKELGITLPLGRGETEVKIRGRRGMPKARVVGRPHLDMYPIIRRSVKLSSYVLENVVRELLDVEKEKIPGEKLWQYWDEGGEKLAELIKYSMEDAEVTLKLSENFRPLQYELTRIVQQPLFDVSRMAAGQLVEWLLMREASRDGELIPNRPAGAEYMRRAVDTYAGGYVREPKKGLVDEIAVFDFRSLYPSVIVTHNIDPSTLISGKSEAQVLGLKYSFTKEHKGFIPRILEALISRRAEIKRTMEVSQDTVEKRMLDVEQRALKLLANSFYGYMGYPRARWYRKECAESVAAIARMYIQKVIKIAEEEFNLEVVYGDTDSLFVVVPGGNIKTVQGFLDHANKTLPGVLELEYEGFYSRGIFVTKKRYALIDRENKIIVKGLEFVRRDWAPITKKTQEEVLRALLKDANPEKAANLVRKTVDAIKAKKVSLEDLTLYTQLTKRIESYKNIAPHVEAAKKLRKSGREVTPGMIIGYVITSGKGKISHRAVPAELATMDDVDPNYYIKNQIMPAMLRIIESIGYSEDYLKDGMKQKSIKRWFG